MNPYLVGGVFVFYLLSCLGCGVFGYEYEAAKCSAKDNAHDLKESQNTTAATQHVVGVVSTQGTISQEASKQYATDFSAITSLYDTGGVQSTPAGPVGGVPTVRPTPGGACPPAKTRVYHLTPKQCDGEEAKLNRLWNWANAQAAVK